MKRFILTATIAVALLGTSLFANAQSRDDRYNNNGGEQYENNRGNEGQYDDRDSNAYEQYGYNGEDESQHYEDESQRYDDRQAYGYDDRQDYNNGPEERNGGQAYRGDDGQQDYNREPQAQGGINRPDYGMHEMNPVRAQYLRLRQLRRMAMADGYLTYQERMMLAREEDKLDWLRSRYGRF